MTLTIFDLADRLKRKVSTSDNKRMNMMIPLFNISSQVTKQDGSNNGIWNHQDKINTQKEIIIGFSPTNYHTFIICGEQEFHLDLLLIKVTS